MDLEAGAVAQVLAQQDVSFVVAAALPWYFWIAEVDLHAGARFSIACGGPCPRLVRCEQSSVVLEQADTVLGQGGGGLGMDPVELRQHHHLGCSVHEGADGLAN